MVTGPDSKLLDPVPFGRRDASFRLGDWVIYVVDSNIVGPESTVNK